MPVRTAMTTRPTSPAASHTAPGSATADMGQAEWDARVQLAACYRIFDLLGWTELIYNHITLRLADGSGFLINPFGLHYSEVRASNLVKVDVAGRILGHSDYPVNPAGFTIHSAVHAGIANAHCVMHTHTTAGSAVSCAQGGLSMTNFYAANLWGQVAYHDFEGITVNADEGPRLVRDFGDRKLMILRNHGLLAHGETVAEAFVRLWTLNRACEIQLASASLGPLIAIPQAVGEQASRAALQFDPKFGAGRDVFDAYVRLVDARDPSYRS